MGFAHIIIGDLANAGISNPEMPMPYLDGSPPSEQWSSLANAYYPSAGCAFVVTFSLFLYIYIYVPTGPPANNNKTKRKKV
jgi:hypothetical protein